LRRPGQIGAVAPSSPTLAGLLAEVVPRSGTPVVVELGPGTGAVTTAIDVRLPPGARHLAVELDPRMAGFLRQAHPGLEVVEVAAHDWMKDPLSRTTWMTHRPGQLTRDLAGLQQPAGVVHFASSDNASLWGGFVDGAIESGLREARRVAAELAPAG